MRLFALLAPIALLAFASVGCVTSVGDGAAGDATEESAIVRRGCAAPAAGTYHVTYETVSGDCGDIAPRDEELTVQEPWLAPPYSVCTDAVDLAACTAVDEQSCKTLTPAGLVHIDSTWTYELTSGGATFSGKWDVALSSATASTSCSYRFSAAR